jgi:Fic family protein
MTVTAEAPNWPSLTYEQRPWVSQILPGVASRTQLRRHQGPYRASLPARIANLPVTLPADTLSASADAANEVSRFDAEMGGEIAPFSAVLLRSEAAASSQIENLTASARAISEAELGQGPGSNAAQIIGNVAAMRAALALSKNVTAQAILDMHAALMQGVDPQQAGHWREEQVWVGGSNIGPHQALFVPPHYDHVEPAIDDLVRFIARDDVPVLAHAAIAHAQFETIHPFTDGNGRTGRALIHAMLRGNGLTRNVTVPMSSGLLIDTQRYFDALTTYRAGNPAQIVDRLTEAAFTAVANGRQLVADLRALRADWQTRVRARKGATVWRVGDMLLRQPVINANLVSKELGIATPNVYRTIKPLIDAGILTVSHPARRDRVWRSAEVLAAVDAFAARAGRRAQPI